MKGVEAVIAIILILMIVIALAALAYTWFSGIFASMTGTAGTAVTSTTTAATTQFRIENARLVSGNIVVSIRNIGAQSFNASIAVIGAYVDNNLQNLVSAPAFSGCAGTGSMADKNCVVSYTWTAPAGTCAGTTCTGSATCSNVTKIAIGTGLSDTESIIC